MSARERSHWGWGWADKFPGEVERRALAAQVGALLGVAPSPRAPRPLAEAALPAARLAVPDALVGFCSAAPAERVTHTYGRSYRDLVRGFAGDFAAAPDLVARPHDEAEVGAALDWCAGARVAVIPYGGGTSVVGGIEAAVGAGYGGALSLDLRGLDRVLEVDAVSRAARIQAGATGPGLEAQLAGHDLTLRHFPQSFEFSTLGGWIATRAGGHFATLYTHIDDLVESVRMLTPRGWYESRRLPASGAGPSPDRLVLGSEGILGVITEAWVRVQSRPRWRTSASLHYARFEDAVAATRAIAQAGLYPTNCRLLDAHEALLNRVTGDGSCVLIVAFESADHPLEAWMARALELGAAHGGTCPRGPITRDSASARGGGDAAASWKAAFVEAPYLQSALVSLGVIADTFETACTWDRFAELHAAVQQAVRGALREVCGGGLLTCRFTHVYPDGPAPYYTFLGLGRAGGELAQWAEIKQAASEALLAHGATITHHHAVGRAHRPWYDRQRPEPFAIALRAAKTALDPDWLLNPGVLVDR